MVLSRRRAMSLPVHRFAALGALLLIGVLAGGAAAQNDKTKLPPAPLPPEKVADSGVARYCANVAPLAAEARIAWESRRLDEIDAQVKQRIADLEKTEADARDWVNKRQAMLNTATDDVVAIYTKMDAEAAAAQLATMDDPVAVAILAKLKTNAASAILNEMDAARASKLTGLILATQSPEKKS
jgi:flagellar motility protein MotE (MotC chaperone)